MLAQIRLIHFSIAKKAVALSYSLNHYAAQITADFSRMDLQRVLVSALPSFTLRMLTVFKLRMPLLRVLFGLMLSANAIAQDHNTADSEALELGRRIYNEGILSSGAKLTGKRLGHDAISGASAACVNCHRRSGLGQVEADILIPPITGNYLYSAIADKPRATMDPRVSKLFNQAHDPYTDETLANAIRNGINSHGQAMGVVMPRYDLADADAHALIVYLKQLSSQWSPGVNETNIRFATVITPDVAPQRRKVFIDMMQTIVRQKNSSTSTAKQGRSRRHMTSAAEMVLGTERKWDLDIWELQGAPETWNAQLTAHYQRQPVFALVSGISNTTWQPVHDFCQNEQLPCWFPSVDVTAKNQSPYSFYFSAGVALESAVLTKYLLRQKVKPKHVVQIYREDAAGRIASLALADGLAKSGVTLSSHALKSGTDAAVELQQILSNLNPENVVMYWLRPEDIQALADIQPATKNNYFSAQLAKGEGALLPEQWKPHSLMIYPYELPQNRTKNLDYFYAWLNMSKLPLIDEAMQSEVFFAMNFMTDTLSEMLENIHREYLIERAETMLSKREGAKAEQETRDRVALGQAGDLERKHGMMTIDPSARIKIQGADGDAKKSQGTTLYPRLSLGPNQRYASKSAYIVRFGIGTQIIAVSESIVP